MLANLARSQRPVGFHQHHPASLGETRLAAATFAVHQLQQLFTQSIVTKQMGQSNDGLLHRTDTLHDIGPLTQQLLEFFVCRPHYFLDMWITAAGKVFAPASVTSTSRAVHDRPPTVRRRACTRLTGRFPAHTTPASSTQKLSHGFHQPGLTCEVIVPCVSGVR